MTVRDWIAGALLAGGVGVQLAACLGVLAARDVFQRLHYAAPAGVLGGPLVCAAVLVNEGFSQAGVKAAVVALLLLLTVPVLTHATAAAARVRQTGGWEVLPPEARRAREP